jgi:hypothetical protein
MADLKVQQQKISKYLDDIVDSSKTRSLKLNEEKVMIKRLVKEMNNFRKHTKSRKKTKTKVHLKQLVSHDVYKFMGINTIIKLSKADVMQFICNYIKDKGLQNPDNRRYFTTNKELSKLFRVKYKTYMTTIEIMKYIHPHFLDVNVVKLEDYINNNKAIFEKNNSNGSNNGNNGNNDNDDNDDNDNNDDFEDEQIKSENINKNNKNDINDDDYNDNYNESDSESDEENDMIFERGIKNKHNQFDMSILNDLNDFNKILNMGQHFNIS